MSLVAARLAGPVAGAVVLAAFAVPAAAWAQDATPGMPGMAMPAAQPVQPTVKPANKGQGTTVDVGPLSQTRPPSGAFLNHEPLYGAVLIDQLEYRGGGGTNIGAWQGLAYFGGDYDKIWINTRGEYNSRASGLERAEVQLLYSRLISYFFNAQVGVREDIPIRPNAGSPSRTHLVLGVDGLLPNLFQVNLQVFLDERGTAAARFEGSYDAYLTQRLVLQPQVEINAAANADPRARLGTGLTRLEAGLRLRYEFRREFAPYVGIQYERVLGDTIGIYQRYNDQTAILSAVTGIRLFF